MAKNKRQQHMKSETGGETGGETGEPKNLGLVAM
tara:strand:- start:512 stop:613 length:102 start_codon:yes stop_codon:yes gene_type:complete